MPVVRSSMIVASMAAAVSLLVADVPAAAGASPPVTPDWPQALPAPPVPTPEIDGLEARLDAIVAALEAKLAEHHVPGAGLAIVVGGKPVLVRGIGVRDLATGEPVTADTVFAIGSATKSMTALLAAAAEYQGGPSLDARVAERLPEFRFNDADTNERITFEDLLTHRSGVMRTDLMWYGGFANWDDIRAAFARAEPVAPLGESFNYQNVCYLAAGRILGEWSKRGWDGHLADRILRPLGMESSGTDIALLRDPARAATGYEWGELGKYAVRDEAGDPVLPWIPAEDLVVADGGDGYWRRCEPRDLSVIAPAGAVNSTPRDMAAWVDLMLRRGTTADGTALLAADAFENAWTPRVTVAAGISYGLGFFIREWDGRRRVDHGGNIDGFSAHVSLLPDDGIGYALLTNLTATPVTALADDIVFGGLLRERGDAADDSDGEDATAESPESLRRYVGMYDASLLFGKPVEVRVRDGRLVMDVPGQIVYELTAPDADGRRAFVGFPQIQVQFVDGPPAAAAEDDDDDEAGDVDAADAADAEPPVQSVRLFQNGLAFEWLREGASYPVDVPLVELTPLLGSYRADEMPRAFRVLVRQNRLALEVPGETTYFLAPPSAEGWWTFRETDALAVRFDRVGDDPATGMTLRSPSGELELVREAADADDPLPDVRIVEFSVQSNQGRDEWEARLGIRLTGRVRMVNQGLEGACSLDLAGYDRMRDRLDLGLFGWMETGMFGQRVWFDASFQSFGVLPEDAAPVLGQMHPALPMADWRQVYDSVAVIGRRAEGDRRMVMVQGERAGMRPTTLFIDDRSWLVNRIETTVLVPGAGMIPRTITFEDYREIEGFTLPMRIITDDRGIGRVVREYDAWELDPEVGQEVFRKNDPAG
jgi:CubicO group peptidase (beta-lactamase class C family)